jgi:hypothetical protein
VSCRDRWGKRGKLREIAESSRGKEVYGLHDNGVLLADSQAKITPIQRFVYTLAKDHHTDDDVKDPKGMKGAHSATRGF